MSKTYLGREIDAALCKKGFLRDASGDHIRYFFQPEIPGITFSIVTKISHGKIKKAIGANLIVLMAHQLHLMKQQFLDFIDCRLSEEEYKEILKKQDEFAADLK